MKISLFQASPPHVRESAVCIANVAVSCIARIAEICIVQMAVICIVYRAFICIVNLLVRIHFDKDTSELYSSVRL